MKKTISITAFNESGVLTRISTVFSSRGFNIDSIAVGPTETVGVSRITIVLPGNDQVLDQVIKQLNKLVQIIQVKDVTTAPCVERELNSANTNMVSTICSAISLIDDSSLSLVD